MDSGGASDAARRAGRRSSAPSWHLPAAASGVVVGAPGTGKTTTLVARVAALVEAGVDPDAMLVLTPSRQTATALRDRLALAVGRATSGPLARSVASFAFQLVRATAVAAGDEPPQLLTGGDEDQLIQDLLDGDAEDEVDGLGRWPEWLPPAIAVDEGLSHRGAHVPRGVHDSGHRVRPARALADAQRSAVWVTMASFFAEYLAGARRHARCASRCRGPRARGRRRAAHRARRAPRRSTASP